MISDWEKIQHNPWAAIKRILLKTLVWPLKYKRGDDYLAQAYWQDRFSKYGLSIKGPGDEGLTEKQNQEMYEKAGQIFLDLCAKHKIDLSSVKILEIGCGNGFYTQLLADRGAQHYLGIDITDVLFPTFRQKYPHFQFLKMDVTEEKISGQFDLIIMLDVIQHIVKETKLDFALKNVRNCLADQGLFFVSPLYEINKKHLFYVHFWSLSDLLKKFPGFTQKESVSFREALLLILQKQVSDDD